MAHILRDGERSVLKIREFLGLNENPDGDTHIRVGELSELRNFRITADHHLQLRPGQKTVLRLRTSWDALSPKPTVTTPRLTGLWTGLAAGREHTLAAFGGAVWDVSPAGDRPPRYLGAAAQAETTFFGFADKVYLLNGQEYLSWDGGKDTTFEVVTGYIPTVAVAVAPTGGGVALEKVNRLTGLRKVKFSPDGRAVTFQLPETEVDEITAVEGAPAKSWTLNAKAGTVTFNRAPDTGVNTLVVTYRKGRGEREKVTKMRYAELYNGVTDARVFLYGDGSNRCIYSGADYEKGVATAEYFPDLCEAAVGEANSPITAMIRHYGRLLAFKPDAAWALDWTLLTLPDGSVTAAFNVTPVNRGIGNQAPGQVKILENNPLTVSRGAVYQWKTAGTGVDHRSAQRIDRRVRRSLGTMDPASVVTYNRQGEGEFWFLSGGIALVLNYGNDTWYRYTNMDFCAMTEVDGELYGFRSDGSAAHISRAYRSDDGKPIDGLAATGAMDFDRDWMTKYSPGVFVALQPESGARLEVTVETNRRSDYPYRQLSAGLAAFSHADFGHWSFGTNRKPQVRRVKLKVKKATFYKLIYRSRSASATATVLETDVRVRVAGMVK